MASYAERIRAVLDAARGRTEVQVPEPQRKQADLQPLRAGQAVMVRAHEGSAWKPAVFRNVYDGKPYARANGDLHSKTFSDIRRADAQEVTIYGPSFAEIRDRLSKRPDIHRGAPGGKTERFQSEAHSFKPGDLVMAKNEHARSADQVWVPSVYAGRNTFDRDLGQIYQAGRLLAFAVPTKTATLNGHHLNGPHADAPTLRRPTAAELQQHTSTFNRILQDQPELRRTPERTR